jgi:NAD(P)-dependent dehydrogenase (short-subunit alcohol dehydrogenase family)
LRHLSAIWNAELAGERIQVLSVDPGDMDTPLHAAAVPDADRSELKPPAVAAAEILEWLCAHLPLGARTGIAA